jgi:hypothetical protein
MTSGLHPEADIVTTAQRVSKVPTTDADKITSRWRLIAMAFPPVISVFIRRIEVLPKIRPASAGIFRVAGGPLFRNDSYESDGAAMAD